MYEFLKQGKESIPTLSGVKFTHEDVSGDGTKCLEHFSKEMIMFNGFDEVNKLYYFCINDLNFCKIFLMYFVFLSKFLT